jgi:CRP-like cAMP-binding protein
MMAAILRFALSDTSTYPGQERLAKYLDCHVNTVASSLKRLETSGEISVTRGGRREFDEIGILNQAIAPNRRTLPFARVPHAVTTRQSLSNGAFRLYALLLTYSSGRVAVGDRDLGSKLGVTADRIQRRRVELRAEGLIRWQTHGRSMRATITVHPAGQVPWIRDYREDL